MEQEPELLLSVSEFVALTNQTLEFAYPSVIIEGELANFRVSKNRWVYFDLKDDDAIVRLFGTVYNLPGPLEDGMLLKVRGQPRLHPQYGFSVTIQTIQPSGEGTIRRASELLQRKLTDEGLFDPSRKRALPYPPERIGLITSKQSAAYADFTKILAARWGGIAIQLIDVQVQGEVAPDQIVAALQQFNALAEPPDAIVVIRGGGSAEDLAAFSTELVTRAIATSRVPTIVAIGHEIDLSLAEMAADQQASTPSNAAELLVPDKRQELNRLYDVRAQLESTVARRIREIRQNLVNVQSQIEARVLQRLSYAMQQLTLHQQLLEALNPTHILARGYAVVRDTKGTLIRSVKQSQEAGIVNILFSDGTVSGKIQPKEH